MYVSYKLNEGGKVYVPKKEVIIEFENEEEDKKNCIYLPRTYFDGKEGRQKITGQWQSGYFNIENFEEKLKKVNKYLVDKTNSKNSKPESFKKSLLDIIGRPSDELAFSNWLSKYLQNEEFFDFFLEDCLKLNLSKNKKDNREAKLEQSTQNRNRIDLWLENDEYIILIENKVQSSIHTSKIKDEKEKITLISQLDDYYKKGEDQSKQASKKLKTFFICPNYYSSYYHIENIDGIKLWDKEKWIEIKYSEIKDSIERFINSKELKADKDKSKNYPYIDEIVLALEKHCKDTPFSMKEIVLDKIANKL